MKQQQDVTIGKGGLIKQFEAKTEAMEREVDALRKAATESIPPEQPVAHPVVVTQEERARLEKTLGEVKAALEMGRRSQLREIAAREKELAETQSRFKELSQENSINSHRLLERTRIIKLKDTEQGRKKSVPEQLRAKLKKMRKCRRYRLVNNRSDVFFSPILVVASQIRQDRWKHAPGRRDLGTFSALNSSCRRSCAMS